MSTTITKRAEDLRPGDVFSSEGDSFVVVRSRAYDCPQTETGYAAHVLAVSLDDSKSPGITSHSLGGSFAVEAPALSPAQQHAEELLGIARRAYDGLHEQAPWKAEIGRVLAKIDPPAPPTLEEALALLQDMHGNGAFDADYGSVGRPQQEKARNFLDRARRAKIIP